MAQNQASDLRAQMDVLDMMAAFTIWGCIPETTANCLDMTNASSAYLGIFIGSIMGGFISWLI